VDAYATRAAADGELVAQGGEPPAQGWYSRPTVVTGLPTDSAVLREEVFGPLLTVEAVPDVDAACDVVDGLPFGLTGGLFSRDPRTVEAVVRRSPVGNLYVNRGITGAMVGRQPFGGNRLSGTGTKAGGPHYLLEFVEPRAVTENTVRHGLVADL
jgi:RHH-type proline utilization regulon transcriptional repressor/proline dehydrogenase/delta 1-pyrroline-5-carboxylate dehydrogenase